MDSGASSHMTPDSGNISLFCPLRSSSIVVGNGSTLHVTASSHSVLPGPFFLNHILVAPDIIKNLISVRQFTIDNNCFVEFDPFGLSMKDLNSRSVIARCNSSGPLYTLAALVHSTVPCALVAAAPLPPGIVILSILGMRLCPNSLVFLLLVVIKSLAIHSVMHAKLGATLDYLLQPPRRELLRILI